MNQQERLKLMTVLEHLENFRLQHAKDLVHEMLTAGQTPTDKARMLWMTQIGPSKIDAIKAVRSLTGLGLREAKDIVESLPRALGEYPEDHRDVKWLREQGCALEWR